MELLSSTEHQFRNTDSNTMLKDVEVRKKNLLDMRGTKKGHFLKIGSTKNQKEERTDGGRDLLNSLKLELTEKSYCAYQCAF